MNLFQEYPIIVEAGAFLLVFITFGLLWHFTK